VVKKILEAAFLRGKKNPKLNKIPWGKR